MTDDKDDKVINLFDKIQERTATQKTISVGEKELLFTSQHVAIALTRNLVHDLFDTWGVDVEMMPESAYELSAIIMLVQQLVDRQGGAIDTRHGDLEEHLEEIAEDPSAVLDAILHASLMQVEDPEE